MSSTEFRFDEVHRDVAPLYGAVLAEKQHTAPVGHGQFVAWETMLASARFSVSRARLGVHEVGGQLRSGEYRCSCGLLDDSPEALEASPWHHDVPPGWYDVCIVVPAPECEPGHCGVCLKCEEVSEVLDLAAARAWAVTQSQASRFGRQRQKGWPTGSA